MNTAEEMLSTCRSTFNLAAIEEDMNHKLALRIAGRAMLKGIGAALRRDGLERGKAETIYHAYLGWRADRGGNSIFWTFINVEDCASSEMDEPEIGLERHFEALAWWEQQLRKLKI